MQTENNTNAFTNNYVIEMYSKYMELYQQRYSGIFFFIVTWAHISYWRKNVTFLGGICVSRGLITKGQYLKDKNTVYGNPDLIKRVQQCTVYNKKDLTGGSSKHNTGVSNCAG
jgi:hypothetical protein